MSGLYCLAGLGHWWVAMRQKNQANTGLLYWERSLDYIIERVLLLRDWIIQRLDCIFFFLSWSFSGLDWVRSVWYWTWESHSTGTGDCM